MWSFTPSTVDTENSTCIELDDRQNPVMDKFYDCAFMVSSFKLVSGKHLLPTEFLIQELTAGCESRHVASASNPADLISRGTNPETLKNCRLWWVGPEWLSQHQEQWLNTPALRHPEPPPEQREVTTVKIMIHCSPAEFITRFSTLSRLQRVAAYSLRIRKTN